MLTDRNARVLRFATASAEKAVSENINGWMMLLFPVYHGLTINYDYDAS